jgi:hypothetical protein
VIVVFLLVVAIYFGLAIVAFNAWTNLGERKKTG